MGNNSGPAVQGAVHPHTTPLSAVLLEHKTIDSTLHQPLRHPAASLALQAKRSREDCLTKDEMISDDCMRRDEYKQRPIGGDSGLSSMALAMEADDWKGCSLKDPWMVKTIVVAPWNKWSLAAEEEDITEMPIPHVGNHTNVTGLCRECFHPCEHHMCTECGAFEYFPEADCGVEGCVRSLYSFHPECYCLFSHDAESMPIGSVQDALPRGSSLSPQ